MTKMNSSNSIKLALVTSGFLLFFCVLMLNLSEQQTVDDVEAISTQRPWLSPPSSGPCTCQPGSVLLKDHVPKEKYNDVVRRREEEYKKHKNRTSSELSKVLVALSNSPLQYPIQGFTVKPMRSSIIPGLALYPGKRSRYKVTLKVTKGVLSTGIPHNKVTVKGNRDSELTLESCSLSLLNALLSKVSYTSTVYHVHTGDLASFTFENHEAVFPIVIKQPQLPVMYDTGTDINSQVTITVKTFLRYDALRVLLNSIRTFYNNIKVIIADDSFDPQKISGENIEQYFMPPAQGWFAGRNLAVSQVTTKYFLWVDDDFVFTKDTKIEKMVEIMEAVPELDVLGGSVQGNQFFFSLEYDEGEGAEGGCLNARLNEKFHAVPGYPQCFLVSGVVNFFLARTDVIRKTRFDPQLKRVAHPEFFMDGLGSLMVATCKDMVIGHQPKTSHNNSARYNQFRSPTKDEMEFKYQMYFYKNNLKCILRW